MSAGGDSAAPTSAGGESATPMSAGSDSAASIAAGGDSAAGTEVEGNSAAPTEVGGVGAGGSAVGAVSAGGGEGLESIVAAGAGGVGFWSGTATGGTMIMATVGEAPWSAGRRIPADNAATIRPWKILVPKTSAGRAAVRVDGADRTVIGVDGLMVFDDIAGVWCALG
jgi:hypothetical protein